MFYNVTQVTLHFKRLKKYGKMYCFITSYTRKTSNEVFKRNTQVFESLQFVSFVKRSWSIKTKTEKEIESFRKTINEIFETLYINFCPICEKKYLKHCVLTFVRFVKRSIWNIVFCAICEKKYLKHCVLCDLWKEVEVFRQRRKKRLNLYRELTEKYLKHCVLCDLWKDVEVFRQRRKKRLNLYTELTEVVSIFKVLFILEKAHI
jgi:hypothetical protein